jgi:phosphonate transport system substrate-binding protein
MQDTIAKIQNAWFVCGFICLASGFWIMGQLSFQEDVLALPPLTATSFECRTKSTVEGVNKEVINESINTRRFIIYGAGESNSTLLNNIACKHPSMQQQFGHIISFWGASDVNTIATLGNGIANLALVKEDIFKALKADQTHGYKKIAYYPDYQSFFIGFNEKPELTKEYFLDKKVGLIVYPTSRSGHIEPKRVFNELGLSLSKMNIKYASSHKELRQFLISGKVDIIASYWDENDSVNLAKDNITLISEAVDGTAWYLKMPKENKTLWCSAREILKSVSMQQTSAYYQNIQLVESSLCERNSRGNVK